METVKTAAEKNVDFAKNYPLLSKDGLHQPVTVGNITEYNGRTIINLACKTQKSGDRNASYSCPSDWKDATRFTTGQVVMVQVVDGYVKKIHTAAIEQVGKKSTVSAAQVNKEVKSALEIESEEEQAKLDAEESAEKTKKMVLAGSEGEEDEDEKPF